MPADLEQPQQIRAIARFLQPRARRLHGRIVDPTLAPGDLLGRRDLEALARLDGLHELPGLEERLEGARVEPRKATAHALDEEIAAGKIRAVDIGDLELAPRGWLHSGSNIEHIVVIEIKPSDGEIRFRTGGFFFDVLGPPGRVKADDAVALGVLHLITENCRAAFAVGGASEQFGEPAAVEDVVAEDERDAVVADELAPDGEGLGQALGPRLLGIGEREAPLRPVAEKPVELLGIVGGGDHQHIADPRQHQHRQRVVDHRLVVDGQKLFRHAQRQRVEARARAPRQNDPLHRAPPLPCLD